MVVVQVSLLTCITGCSTPRSSHSRVRSMLFASFTFPDGRSVQQSGSPRIRTRLASPETVPLAKPLEKLHAQANRFTMSRVMAT